MSATHLSLSEVSRAPNEIGVYAWYARPSIGAADWMQDREPDTNRDLGVERLQDLLISFTRKLDPSPFHVEGKSSFEYVWEGDLIPSLRSEYDVAFEKAGEQAKNKSLPSDARDRAQKIWKSLQTQRRRGALSEILSNMHSDFAAPLYIGRSKNIRERVMTHARTFRKYSAALAEEPHRKDEMLAHIRQQDLNFGARAAALDFAADELYVIPLTIADQVDAALTDAELEQVSVALEWLLNRWYRPICGRL